MPIRMLDENGTHWIVQAQRGNERRTRRIEGSREAALAAERELIEGLAGRHEAGSSGKELGGARDKSVPSVPSVPIPTLREYYEARWKDHMRVMQRESTRSGDFSRWNYLLHYLGDKTLDDCARPRTLNAFIERLATDGALSFAVRRNEVLATVKRFFGL